MAQGMRFLVVEDNQKLRKFVVEQLRELGVLSVPYEAEDASRAQAMLDQESIDFVIAGWNLPEIGGPGFVRMIRSNPGLRRLYVLLLATEAKRDNAFVAAEAGANDFILRPFGTDALEKKIGRIATLARMLSQPGGKDSASAWFCKQPAPVVPMVVQQPVC